MITISGAANENNHECPRLSWSSRSFPPPSHQLLSASWPQIPKRSCRLQALITSATLALTVTQRNSEFSSDEKTINFTYCPSASRTRGDEHVCARAQASQISRNNTHSWMPVQLLKASSKRPSILACLAVGCHWSVQSTKQSVYSFCHLTS